MKRTEGNKMELTSLTEQMNLNDSELAEVAMKIRPLPQEVAPSPEFMSRTRLRLLMLDPSGAQSGAEARERRAA